MIDNFIVEMTKKICNETQLFNIALKKSKPGLNIKTGKAPLDSFFWHCWECMLPQAKHIHLLRSQILYYSDAYQAEPDKQHEFFVNERIKQGWTLSDERVDYVFENDCFKWIGHDPYLKPLSDCPDWFQQWCIDRNKIAENITKEFLCKKYCHMQG